MEMQTYKKEDKRVKPKYEKVECNRCGQCCENMALSIPPKKMRLSFLNWFNNKKKGLQFQSTWFTYPSFEYIGYDRKVKKYRYRCKHFTRDKDGLGVCTVYNIRPKYPCIDFGRDEARGIKECSKPGKGNKRLYPKCVF